MKKQLLAEMLMAFAILGGFTPSVAAQREQEEVMSAIGGLKGDIVGR
ncbi:MAG: hypothetical protein JOZ80_19740 [Acidobacteriaceae bacterium]|nr:hypothetical protein [Acidobacteriaceae bacterium]